MTPKLSIVVVAYEMTRELPRTLLSLSPLMQRGIVPSDYEIVVVDNGSRAPVDPDALALGGVAVRTIDIPREEAAASPCAAINAGLAAARGALVGVMIDGARLASPGLLAQALAAARALPGGLIVTLAFHLGPKVQMESVKEGYDQHVEDRLLAAARWEQDGYRLFDISVLAASSKRGWSGPLKESNALFLTASQWSALGGYDERFVSPGGGHANLDMILRAVRHVDGRVVTLLGEGTFHQVHGGVATNAAESRSEGFSEEFQRICGSKYRLPVYDSLYVGEITPRVLKGIAGTEDGS